MKGFILTSITALMLVGIQARATVDTVAILVDSLIYNEIEAEIAEYVTSVEAQFPVKMLVYHHHDWKNKSFLETRQFIKGIWETYNIKGVVLVGFFPMMLYQVHGQGTFPMVQAAGYEDIDGEFLDDGAWVMSGSDMIFLPGEADDTLWVDAHGHQRIFTDNIYDHHSWGEDIDFSNPQQVEEKVRLELWVALIRPYQDTYNIEDYTDNAIAQLKDYFVRCNRYNNKQLPYQRRGFVQSSSDWGSGVTSLANIIEPAYGEENVAAYIPKSSGYSYMRERAIGIEAAFYFAHSSSWFHQNDRGPFSTINRSDLGPENGPGALLTFGFNCHGADYLETPTGCLGQYYVFESSGLSFVGNTISTGNNQHSMAEKMVAGKYLGEAFLATLNHDFQQGVLNGDVGLQTHGLWGNIILGTPFIWMNQETDMTGPGARVQGETSNGQDVIMTFFKNNNIYTIACSEAGIIDVTKLDTGNYVVEVETKSGLLLEDKELTVSSVDEVITDWDIEIPETGPMFPDNYYLKVENNNDLPADWSDDGADLNEWKYTEAQVVGAGVQDYHFLSTKMRTYPAGSVYIRKHFNIYNPNPDFGVYVYSAIHNASLYVNGTTVYKEPTGDRNIFSAFNTVFDISDVLVEGGNYMVGRGYDIMHISDPVYEMMYEPVVSLPLDPSDLEVTKQDETTAYMTWTDNSDNEDGFILERNDGYGDFYRVAYLGLDKTELTHEIEEGANSTIYRICAYNYAGLSDFSNESTLAIDDNDMPGLAIYPNPFGKSLSINCPETNYNISISNVYGQQIFKGSSDNKLFRINTEEFEKGLYIISLTTQNNRTVTKSVIKY